jgi:hypothetical protein
MKNKNLMSHFFKFLILIFGLALIFTSCLSSEDEGDGTGTTQTGATLTESNAPKTADAAIKATMSLGAFTGLGEMGGIGTSTVSSDTYAKSPLGRIIDRALSITKIQKSTAELFAQGSIPQVTEDCTDGGSMTMSATWTGPDQPSGPSDMTDFTVNITFNSCTEGTETNNGTFTVAFSGSSDNPTGISFTTSNFTHSDTVTNDNMTMTNVSVSITVSTMDGGGEITDGIFTLDGAMSGTIDGNTVNLEYDDFEIVLSSDPTGETLSISGSLKANCVGGWITVTTNTPVYIPTVADCPTQGDITITSGGNTVDAVVGSDSTITVYFNDTLVQTYADCEAVDGLCTS